MALKLLIIFIFSLALYGAKINIIDIHGAWRKFPSADISGTKTDINFSPSQKYKSQNITDFTAIKKEKIAYLAEVSGKLIKTNPKDKAYMSAGILYAQNGFLEKSLTLFQKALTFNKANGDIYNNIANIYYIRRKYDEAIKYYLKALDYSENNPNILLNLAFIYYEKGEFDKARENYFTAILIDPTLDSDKYKILASESKN